MEKKFVLWKKQCLEKLDASKKGSVDENIQHVVTLLNGCEQFFTTSSCSGRIIIIDGVPDRTDVQKQNCSWLFVSHQKCSEDELTSSLARSEGDAVLKFEPFVLHVQCRKLEDAQLVELHAVDVGPFAALFWKCVCRCAFSGVRLQYDSERENLHSAAVNSGFRNSGLTVGKTGKIMAAVRSTHGLEVPLCHKGKLLVDRDYVHFLVQTANQKMEENLRRIDRFFQNLRSVLPSDPLGAADPPGRGRGQEQQTH